MPVSGINSKTLQLGFLCYKEISQDQTAEKQKQVFKERAFQRVMNTGLFANYTDVECVLVKMTIQFRLTRNATVVEKTYHTYEIPVFTSIDMPTEQHATVNEEASESSSESSDEEEQSTCPICYEEVDEGALQTLPCCTSQSICQTCESRVTDCPFCRRRFPRSRGGNRGHGRGR